MKAHTGAALTFGHRLLIGAALIAMVIGLAGCKSKSRLTLDMPKSMESAFDIENPYGPVRVYVDPWVDEITVHVVRSKRSGSKEKKSVVRKVEVIAETLQDVEGRLTTSIIASSDEFLVDDVRVALEITTPRCDGVRVRAAGVILLAGVSGAVQAESVRGSIEMKTNVPVTDPVVLTTGKGDVYLTIVPGSQGRLTVEAPEGRARVHSLDMPLHNIDAGLNVYSAQLQNGTNDILVRTEDGDALLMIIDDPMSNVRQLR